MTNSTGAVAAALLLAIPVWAAVWWLSANGTLNWPAPVDAWNWWLAGVIYPVLEEVVFRGMLQPWLRRHAALRKQLWLISGANLATSIVFSVVHLLRSLMSVALVFLPSLVLGVVRERSDHVGPAIVVHVLFNLGYLGALSLV